ncbi:hypothetical protein FA13DRAFT_1832638 [Coprinellus micaceus]|uniref:Uncharacterized protein n=1 Tax=Coprinellus micaceus TaxID=71717 RepID=A0A4Y7SJE4_COPMI|nr:hypothetical protein FA13DRAFT_1832638 [Coprinellus micaceus]
MQGERRTGCRSEYLRSEALRYTFSSLLKQTSPPDPFPVPNFISLGTAQARPAFQPPTNPWDNIGQLSPDQLGEYGSSLISNSIRTEYHPKRKRAPEIVNLDEYNARRRRPRTDESSLPLPDDRPPYHPFRTRLDFDFAELVFSSALGKAEITQLLSLFKRGVDQEDKLTFEDFAGLQASWEEAQHLVSPFEAKEIKIPFESEEKTYTVWTRDIWKWIVECLENPILAKQFVWDAERLSRRNGDAWERFVNEPWTANQFWKALDLIPEGGFIVTLIIYADKTNLSTFGTAQGYPVYIKIGNLPSETRNGKGLGGGRLVGWIPVVTSTNKEARNSKDWTNHKRIDGFPVECGDGIWRVIHPIILMLSADYEEHGTNNAHPCPACLVAAQNIPEYSEEFEYRCWEENKELVERATSPNSSALAVISATQDLEEVGVRPIENAFWEYPYVDLHRLFAFDRLHNYPGGLAKGRLVKFILGRFKSSAKAIVVRRIKVEKRAADLPRWCGLTHFSHILTGTAYQDSNKWEDMARTFLYILPDIFGPTDRAGRQVLRCLRHFLNLNALSSFENHSDTTIELMRRELKVFSEEVQKLGEITGKAWTFPKMHLQMHMPDDILAKGVTKNYSSKTFEALHKALKVFYQWMTNFRDVDEQILNADHRKYVIEYIKALIEAHKKDLDDLDGNEPPEAVEGKYSYSNVTLKAPQHWQAVPPATFQFNVASELGEYAQHCEGVDLVEEIKDFVDKKSDIIGFSAQGVEFCIQSFRSLETFFTSKETWDIESNIVRCSPDFYNKPRYDAVLIQTTEGMIFGRLLALFIARPTKKHKGVPIALILPYDGTFRTNERNKDQHFGLHRVRPFPQAKAELFAAQSIIRGGLLIPAYDTDTDYFVFDVLDGDMFLRMREVMYNERYPV